MEYKVQVENFVNGVLIIDEQFADANAAYREYRILVDQYQNDSTVVIKLIEPDD